MTTLSALISERPASQTLFQRLWATHWLLTLTGALSLALILVAALGLAVDPRVITGAPAWAKPMKFAISFAIYSFTLVWLLGFVQGHPRLVGLTATLTAIAVIAEMAIIILQAARGVRSHFNFTTPFDATLFGMMGNFAMVLGLMNVLALILLIRQRMPDSTFAWSLRLGLVIALVGMAVGFLMISNRSRSQQAELEAGRQPPYLGAHSVGVEDGGPGLPFVNWSIQGGDLRAAHFVGLHGMQVLPLIGFIVTRRFANRLSERRRTVLVWTAGLGYLGFVLLLIWQALRGQSVIAPDAVTLGALGGLVGAVALVRWAVFASAKRARA